METGRCKTNLGVVLSTALATLAERERSSVATVVLAAYALLLQRHSGQVDLLVGCPVRDNTLVVHFTVAEGMNVAGLIRSAEEGLIAARSDGDVPFTTLSSALDPEPGPSRAPLVQALFYGAEVAERGALTRLDAGIDLGLVVGELDGSLALQLLFSVDRLDEPGANRMLAQLGTLLEGFVADTERTISSIPILSASERVLVLETWNATSRHEACERCVHELFEEQAARTPYAVALAFDGRTLTYAELNGCANQLAHYLRGLGVGAESLVGICMHRSLEMVIGVLGILKAGAAYVPLDPAYPKKRLAYLLADSQVTQVVTREDMLGLLADTGCDIVRIEDVLRGGGSQDNPRHRLTTEGAAYVIYTSGSTGQPKGVIVEHRSLVNYARSTIEAYRIQPEDRVLQFASLSFDASVEEIFPCLLCGAVLVLRTDAMLDTIDGFLRTCEAWGVTVVPLPTAFWHEVVAALYAGRATWPPSARIAILGGEPVQREALARWQRSVSGDVMLMNVYGPTETTVGATFIDLAVQSSQCEVPIGRPFQNVRVYVLDSAMEPVPVGVPGELYIGGAGVARGYLCRPVLSAQRFVPDPWSSEPGARMYRTGDFVRHRGDGNLEFLGRIDQQVKVRGFRIELGEIESALLQIPGVYQAVAMVREDGGRKLIVAYVVAPELRILAAHELRSALETHLPEYMVPAAFVILDALPRSPSGKIDVRALPPPSLESFGGGSSACPRTLVEARVATLFESVLGIQRVGVHDDFFTLGGHSLLAMRLVSLLRELFSVDLGLRAIFEARTVARIALDIDAATRSRRADEVPLVRVPRAEDSALSFAQQRLWILDQLTPQNPFYNLVWAVSIQGTLDVAALRRSLDDLVARHEILRTRYVAKNDEPVQVVEASTAVLLPLTNVAVLTDARGEARQILREDARTPFDLAAGPPFRARVVKVDDEEHWLSLVIHHIAFDGWSGDVLLNELGALYSVHAAGDVAALEPLAIQYADYAVWHRRWLTGNILELQLGYWKKQLERAVLILELPTDRPRPPVQTFRGATHTISISAELAQSLMALARREGVTLFMALLAAFNVLLSRYSGQQDILVGSPISGRTRRETESLIGFFVNTLVLRTRFDGDPSMRELLERTRITALDAYSNQDVPFEHLVSALRPERNLSVSPIFQAFFSLEEESPQVSWSGLDVRPLEIETGTAKLELGLTITTRPDGMVGRFEYNTDLFDASTVERMASHFMAILEQVAADPERRVSTLTLLSERELKQQIFDWNATVTAFPDGCCIHELFEQQVERSPEATAVQFGVERWTYRELDARANRLAHALIRRGGGAERLVGIGLERSVEMVVSVLAVLKVGGAYVPLDPSYPEERLRYMVEDARLAIVLTSSSQRARFRADQVICIDIETASIAALPSSKPVCDAHPLDLAYVIYTSGSTGMPKGVMGHHRGLCNLRQAQLDALGVGPGDRVLQFASLSFDAALWEICMALTTGATLVLAHRETLASSTALEELIEAQSVTVATLPPTMLALLTPLKLSLRLIVSAGEACSEELARAWAARCTFVNAYGPTEATVCATLARYSAEDARPPSIGRPIGNLRVYILDSHGLPAPVGVIGEMHIAGVGLALGYLHRPELTAERFIPDPFRSGERMYRTGDHARYRVNGEIEFIGRVDHQVKLRGYRIELGEIEAKLCAHEAVTSAVVLVREDHPSEQRLVAYVVSQEVLTASVLREHLERTLPSHMVPSAFVVMHALPLTPNGKIDRRALPPPDRSGGSAIAYVSPRNALEEALAAAFRDVLRVERVGIHDNFFELGGHSLLGTRITARAKRELGVDLTLRALFQAPTVAELASFVTRARTSTAPSRPPIVPRDPCVRLPLSLGQREIWLGCQMAEDPSTFNIPIGLHVRGALDIAALERSVTALVARHEALRTTFPLVAGRPVQVVAPAQPVSLSVVPVHALPPAMGERETAKRISDMATRPFDLARGPLLRVTLLKLGAEAYLLLLATHHIVADGWSSSVLLRDLFDLYRDIVSGGSPSVAPLPIQFGDYVLWQETFLQGEALARLVAYWKTQLDGDRPSTELPADFPRPKIRSYKGAARELCASRELLDALRAASRGRGVTIYMLLLTAFYVVLERETGLTDLTVGGTAANRQDPEVQGVIGLFVNMVALRVDTARCATFSELLRAVREVVLSAESHQDLPFGHVVRALGTRHDPSRMPLFQIVLRHETLDDDLRVPTGLTFAPLAQSTSSAKLDLELVAVETLDGLQLLAQFDVALFEPRSIDALLARYCAVLERFSRDLDAPLERHKQHL